MPVIQPQTVARKPTIHVSLGEYGRGIAGGLLFSLPLLCTAEVWQAGDTLTPQRLLIGVLVVFFLLLAYNRLAGVHPDATWAEVVIDSVEELGLGLLLSALILWLLGQLSADMHPRTLLSRVIVEGLLIAVGVSVGTAQLGENQEGDSQPPGIFGQLIFGVCGAVLLATNIAPTQEVEIIALSIGLGQLIGLALLAIVLAAVVLHYSQQAATRRRWGQAIRGAIIDYALALLVAAGLLWFFSRLDGLPVSLVLAEMVVLSVPTTIGAAAGKLLLK